MRLDLETDVETLVEADEPALSVEDTDAANPPVEELERRGLDCVLQQVVDDLAVELDLAGNVLCVQCSLQVCAIVSGSQAVGSRPAVW